MHIPTVGEMPKGNYAYVGSDEPAPGMGGFSDKAIRRGFIRKVGTVIPTFFHADGSETIFSDPDPYVKEISPL